MYLRLISLTLPSALCRLGCVDLGLNSENLITIIFDS